MKLYLSEESVEAAEDFITAIKNGTLSKHVLPNNYEDYTAECENIDLRNYKQYLQSMSYFTYVDNRAVAYNGQL